MMCDDKNNIVMRHATVSLKEFTVKDFNFKDLIFNRAFLILSYIWLIILVFSVFTDSNLIAIISSTGFYGNLILDVLEQDRG